MNSGRSGSKAKGYRPKNPAPTNQKSSQNAQNSNSDRSACGPGGSSSHPDQKSSQNAQNSNSDRSARGPCGSSSHPDQKSAQNAQNINSDRSACGPCGSSSHLVSSSGTQHAPCGSSSPLVPSSGTQHAPSGSPSQSVWGSGKLNFSVGGHSIVVPTEEKSTPSAPSAAIGSRESKCIADCASQAVAGSSGKSAEEPSGSVNLQPSRLVSKVTGSSGKSAEEPSGSVNLQPSRLVSKQTKRDEGKDNVDSKISTQVQPQGVRANEGEGSSERRGGRVGYAYQRGERSGNEEGWNRNRGGRGNRGRHGSQGGESDRIDALGRCLSSVLRHRAVDLNLNIRSDGYVAVNDLLKLNMRTRAGVPLRLHTADDFKEAVKRDNKQRFGLLEENGVLLIRANQGHSMGAINTVMLSDAITSAENLLVCVHGTYLKNLESIQKNGLLRMKRNHVHFARGLPTDSGVISGMRSDCEVYIYLDVQKALKDGMKLFVSENGVILTEGFNGVVPPEYFAKVETVDRRRNRKH